MQVYRKTSKTTINNIIQQYFEDNNIGSFPAPFLIELVPDSNLPSSTSDFVLYGSFFTEDMTVSISGQTVNFSTFVSDNEFRLNVTTGAIEGFFDITLNNGSGDVVFSNALLIVLGEVFKPVNANWTNVSEPIILDDDNIRTKTFGSEGTAIWNHEFDYTKDFQLRLNINFSQFGVVDNGSLLKVIDLINVSDSVVQASLHNSTSGNVPEIEPRLYFNGKDEATTISRISSIPSLTIQDGYQYFYDNNKPIISWIGGVLYYYNGATLIYTSAHVLTENVKLKSYSRHIDILDIKYIELAT